MLTALILTVILECSVLYLLGERDKSIYIYWIAVTSFTNLSLNLCLSLAFTQASPEYWLFALIGELIVLFVEFGLCFVYTNDIKKSIKYSLICNLTSFLIGLIIF